MENGDNGGGNSRPPSSRRRIAVSIFRYYPRGGVQRELLKSVQELVRRGFEVTVFCITWDSPDEPAGFEVRTLPVSGMSRHSKARKFDAMLSREVEREKFDLHIAFSRVSGADWYFADELPLLRRRVKSSWFRKMMPKFRTFAALEYSVFCEESSTRIMYSAPVQKVAYQRLYNTQSERFYRLPAGIDESYRAALSMRSERRERCRAALDVADDEIMLLTLSSACRSKGVDRSVAALADLPDELRRKAKLFICGGDDTEEIAELIARFGVEDRVEFLGWRDDVPELLAAADLLLHPARSDVAGAVLLEAIASGTPVICSGNCGFAGEVAASGGEVLPLPFRQRVLNRTLMMLLTAPEQLVELQNTAADYGTLADFYGRTEAIVDLLESDINK